MVHSCHPFIEIGYLLDREDDRDNAFMRDVRATDLIDQPVVTSARHGRSWQFALPVGHVSPTDCQAKGAIELPKDALTRGERVFREDHEGPRPSRFRVLRM
ncbi:hypothetical protein DMC47_34440 [Nostoc sp. 3335mG]|nr:hypothetical protein DMC47_34440 [Nostoc sp. 3335mG]